MLATFSDLDAPTLYRLLKLRCDVFVVEQQCAYPELDGRDTEPGTVHLWLDDEHGEPAAYLRVLTEPDGSARIGRVVTAKSARGQGLAGRLLQAALDHIGPGRGTVLDAQTDAMRIYERVGFQPSGPAFVEDGIEHVPMRRPAS
ncbi:GNAT family N-acetyltransferase [Dactylosporangium fulvum]|uniref:GNAT family N-acetyltransferase n=1 Tax=Dactylosporangium fulvum TaxID=53359 RepID=A0ABY5W8D0_9ACTN|nr:GNAT family N-acetyltransferase [Dactylosporangium fulvum]UWP84326.1 GNAT family N-acetyltransferase [Dactylosporangium fulvum]